MKKYAMIGMVLVLAVSLLSACAAPTPSVSGKPRVLAVETFLADIAQNVAGERLTVEALMPLGLDPHAFEPSPRDVARISDSDVIIINGGGFEAWLDETIANAGGEHRIIDASNGVPVRTAREGEAAPDEPTDPHFWLNPLNVVRYVENIRDGLSAADPDGKDVYTANAAAYIEKLKALDAEITALVAGVPEKDRLLVTNHESFGYFADRYGFRVIGTVIPSVSTGSSPSAQQLVHLIDLIRQNGVKAVFLETGSNAQLANQLSSETGIRVVEGLYTHSVTAPDGEAPTYLDMLRFDANAIVSALK